MPAYKDEKNNTWYCQFYYKDWTGERKQKRKRGFAKKREAEQWEAEFKTQYDFSDKKKIQQCSNMPFSSFVQIYFDEVSVRKTTKKNKETILNAQILPYFRNLQMDEITPAHIARWQREIKGKGYSQTYLRTINSQLKALFHYAERYYGLKDNPCKAVSPMGKSKPSAEMLFWTLEEYEKVLAVIPENDYRFKLILQTLFWSGCRIEELLALKPDDLEQKDIIRIDQGYNVIDNEEIFDVPKSGDKRCIMLPDFVYNDIKNYVNSIYGIGNDDRIFMISKSRVNKKLKTYAEKAGVKPIRVHDLRHSHAAYLIDQDVNIMVISKRLGHSNPSITWNVYGHLYPGREKDTIKEIAQKYQEDKTNKENSTNNIYTENT